MSSPAQDVSTLMVTISPTKLHTKDDRDLSRTMQSDIYVSASDKMKVEEVYGGVARGPL